MASQPWEAFVPAFEALPARLRRTKWFTKDWEVHIGTSSAGNGSVYAQVYKTNWLNQPGGTGGGVHFEAWMSNADVKRGSFQLALHVETTKARNKISRTDLIPVILRETDAAVERLRGYAVKPTHQMQPLLTQRDVDEATATDRVVEALGELARLAPGIDAALATMIPSRG